MTDIKDGVYDAVIASAQVRQAKTGSLMVTVAVDIGGTLLYANLVIVRSDGSLCEERIKSMMEWAAGWDGGDPYWFESNAKGLPVSVTTAHEVYEGQNHPVIKWVNARGGKGGGKMEPTPASGRAAIMAKFGAKFRAYAATHKCDVTPAPAAKARVPAAPVPVAAPVAAAGGDGMAESCSTQEAWTTFANIHADDKKEDREAAWFALLKTCGVDGKDRDLVTRAEWGKVKAAAEAQVPQF